MLDSNWKPSKMADTIDEWGDTVLPHDGYVDASDAARLMIAYEAQAQQWLDHMANAILYKETAKFKRDSAFNTAFLKSEARSDKQREIDAKTDSLVRGADLILIEATAALKLAEGKYDSAIRSTHAMKALLRDVAQERFL